MVRRTTWILLAAFAVVVLAYAGWQRFVPAPVEATPTFGPDSPWSISPEQVESIRLTALADPAVSDACFETRALIERCSLATNERLTNLFARQP